MKEEKLKKMLDIETNKYVKVKIYTVLQKLIKKKENDYKELQIKIMEGLEKQ